MSKALRIPHFLGEDHGRRDAGAGQKDIHTLAIASKDFQSNSNRNHHVRYLVEKCRVFKLQVVTMSFTSFSGNVS